MRRITKTYSITTRASSRHGDAAEHGFEDEIGYPIEPDEYDIEEYGAEAVAALAARYLLDNGATMPSSSQFHPGIWYTTPDGDLDFCTGDVTTYSYHLVDFDLHEQEAIYRRIKGDPQRKP